MNPERLLALQAALLEDFPSDCALQSCQLTIRADLVYCHTATAVDATSMAPLLQPDIDARVFSWPWPTALAYLQEGFEHHANPYRDFVRARFVWQEYPGVGISGPSGATPTNATTAADGGALIHYEPDADLCTQTLPVQLTIPAQAAQTGYPGLRRVCLSIPGQPGQHAELAADAGEHTFEYPSACERGVLRLIAVMPWFSFELRRSDGTVVETFTGDLWRKRIGYSTTPAAHNHLRLWEASTSTEIGQIVHNTGHYGIQNLGRDAARTVRANHAGDLSASRRLIVAGVLGVEGGPNAIATHDGPKLSWGMNQWCTPSGSTTGEFAQILAYIFDFYPDAFDRCFGRYGLGVTFTGRNRAWTALCYRDPVIFRAPCCGPNPAPLVPSIRAGLDAVGQALSAADAVTRLHLASARAVRLLDREDTTSCAMIYLFYKAGLDPAIQRAQAEWTSFRISHALAGLNHPTNLQVLDAFLIGLGSNMPAADRLTLANQSIAAGRAEGHIYPDLGAAFDDADTLVGWRDWPTRCDTAGKLTTPPATAAQPSQ